MLDDGNEWFCPSTSRKICRPSARKHGRAVGKVHSPAASPSPLLSIAGSPPASQEFAAGNASVFYTFLQEEQQRVASDDARRRDWRRQAAGMAKEAEDKLRKALELVSVLKGEEICIRKQRESLKEQLRALDAQE